MIWDALSDALIAFAINVIHLLPESPFVVLEDLAINEFWSDVLSFVNWFVPIGTMISITEVWLTGVAVYYVYQVALRWVKVIE